MPIEPPCLSTVIAFAVVNIVLGVVWGLAIGWQTGVRMGMRISSEQAKHITERVKFLADLFRRLDATSQSVAAVTKAVDSMQPRKPCPEDEKHGTQTAGDRHSFSQTA